MRQHLGIAFLGLVACVGCLGCRTSGPAIASVSGIIFLDGVPLPSGVVSFVSARGYVSSAPLGTDGRFHLVSQYGDGIPRGTYRVCVLPAPGPPDETSMALKPPAPPSAIPTRYHYPDSSGLSATIEGRVSDLSFQLFTAGDTNPPSARPGDFAVVLQPADGLEVEKMSLVIGGELIPDRIEPLPGGGYGLYRMAQTSSESPTVIRITARRTGVPTAVRVLVRDR